MPHSVLDRLGRTAGLVLALTVLPLGLAQAEETNIDIQKCGDGIAWDFAIVLEGTEHVTSHYDGWDSGKFLTVITHPTGGNTMIHWENPIGAVAGDGITNGEVIHLGFSTQDGKADILDMFWTDENGNRIFGSRAAVVGGHIGPQWVGFRNRFDHPVHVDRVRFAVLPEALPLAELSTQNDQLLATLEPLTGPFEVPAGGVVDVALPEPVPAGHAVVTVADIENAGDACLIVFEQAVPVPLEPQPAS